MIALFLKVIIHPSYAAQPTLGFGLKQFLERAKKILETDMSAEIFLSKIPLQSFWPTPVSYYAVLDLTFCLDCCSSCPGMQSMFLVFILLLLWVRTRLFMLVILIFCANLSK